MKKNIITISENTLRQIVAESLKNVVMEGNYSDLYRKENGPYHDDTTFMGLLLMKKQSMLNGNYGMLTVS